MPIPPEHVLSAFPSGSSARTSAGTQLGSAWDNGIRVGDTVYAQASEWASWSAKVREKLEVAGARIARPVLSSDGRYTAAGWKATSFIEGGLQGRIDETAQLALRLEDALSTAPLPGFGKRDDVFARAERAAWDEQGEALRVLDHPHVVIGHADLLGTTVYSGSNPPAVLDIVPTDSPRPAGWSAAIVIVDGLIAGAVDEGICRRFGHVPDMDQLLLRAASYRRHVNDIHPHSQAITRSHIEAVEEMLVSAATGTLSR